MEQGYSSGGPVNQCDLNLGPSDHQPTEVMIRRVLRCLSMHVDQNLGCSNSGPSRLTNLFLQMGPSFACVLVHYS